MKKATFMEDLLYKKIIYYQMTRVDLEISIAIPTAELTTEPTATLTSEPTAESTVTQTAEPTIKPTVETNCQAYCSTVELGKTNSYSNC